MKNFEKKLNNKYAYKVLSKRINERTNKKNVRVYPVYDKKFNITGIQVTLIKENKFDEFMIRQTLHIIEAA